MGYSDNNFKAERMAIQARAKSAGFTLGDGDIDALVRGGAFTLKNANTVSDAFLAVTLENAGYPRARPTAPAEATTPAATTTRPMAPAAKLDTFWRNQNPEADINETKIRELQAKQATVGLTSVERLGLEFLTKKAAPPPIPEPFTLPPRAPLSPEELAKAQAAHENAREIAIKMRLLRKEEANEAMLLRQGQSSRARMAGDRAALVRAELFKLGVRDA
jgi:hypothetical protein